MLRLLRRLFSNRRTAYCGAAYCGAADRRAAAGVTARVLALAVLAAAIALPVSGCTTPADSSKDSSKNSSADSPANPGITDGEVLTDILKNASPETSALLYFVYDGGAICGASVRRLHINDAATSWSIINKLNAVKAVKVEDWSFEDVNAPIYGIRMGSVSGFVLQFAFSGGLMFTQDGGVYSFDFDFEELEADYDWRESPPLPYFAGFPCARMFTQKDNEWNKAFLEPAPELQPPPGGISVALVQYADDIVTVDFTNSSGREWLYGEAYGIDVLLDGQWHIVPPQREVAFNLPAYPLQDGETKSKDYNLEPYGALPTGTYRITFKDLAAEFVVPAVALG